jgi:hypothetical protein
MLLEIICLGLGAAMFVWPQILARFSQRRHAERLNEIRHGGEEQFFEERRALETYPALAKSANVARLRRRLGPVHDRALDLSRLTERRQQR